MVDKKRQNTQNSFSGDLASEGVKEFDSICFQQGKLCIWVRLKGGKNVGLKEVSNVHEGVGGGCSML